MAGSAKDDLFGSRMTDPATVEVYGDALVVRFTRPESRNPLSIELLEWLENVLDELLKPNYAKRLILTGTGSAFASGADLREISAINADSAKGFAQRGQSLMNKVAGSEKPVIAAINGACFGGALDLALACSYRIADPSATFCHPGTGLGIITGWGGTQRLPRLIGQARALEMFYTASPISAVEAKSIGLIDLITDDCVTASIDVTS